MYMKPMGATNQKLERKHKLPLKKIFKADQFYQTYKRRSNDYISQTIPKLKRMGIPIHSMRALLS